MLFYDYNYVSIMITAYSQLTGRTIDQSLIDLGCAGAIDPADIQIKNKEEEGMLQDLLKDPEGVLRWVEGR